MSRSMRQHNHSRDSSQHSFAPSWANMLSGIAGTASGVFFLFVLLESRPKLATLCFLISGIGIVLIFVLSTIEKRLKIKATNKVDVNTLKNLNFQRYISWLKSQIRGHDGTINRICLCIQQNLELAGPGRHLGAFLLVGPSGTGKTYLAEMIGKALYANKEILTLDFAKAEKTDLEDEIVQLIKHIESDPYRVLIFENIDKAEPDAVEWVTELIQNGEIESPSTRKPVSLAGCLLLATSNETSNCAGGGASHSLIDARKTLCQNPAFDMVFLSVLDDIFLWNDLHPIFQSEIACIELQKHWATHGLSVSFASPKLIFGIIQSNSELQFRGVKRIQQAIRAISHSAILIAKAHQIKKVFLDIDRNGNLFIDLNESRSA